ncbi:hypothetical protein FSP39_008537 [Pinctada imbricata]|uniref:Solute carrier family 12 member 2 n=1 Tax=Pinctada imbricata TaxID=66713 RepID=A0AA88YI12_PINIB|nr:hypothetical protein FSP39_008537 [Pinctada imbricata]
MSGKTVEVSDTINEKQSKEPDTDGTTPNTDVKIEITDPSGEKTSVTESGVGGKTSIAVPVQERKVSNVQIHLEGISEDDSEDSQSRSRKSSHATQLLHYVPLAHANQRKLSADPFYLNPRRYSIDPLRRDSRKISLVHDLISPGSGEPSRKTSVEAFYLPGIKPKYSLISVGSDWDQQDTFETLPHEEHYSRDLYVAVESGDLRQRPTLEELRSEESKSEPRTPGFSKPKDLFEDELEDPKYPEPLPQKRTSDPSKFGWIQGVLVRCLLNIFGVMLFLRMTWITGQAGIGLTSVIILLSSFVTTVTTLSMSAICTNGEVKGGGAYYMISRSLGPEFGGSIGVVFSLANAVAAAMYVVGFAETVQGLMSDYNATITGHALNDVRIIGCATSVLLLGIVIIGMEWEAKAQLGLLVILTTAIVNYFVGTLIPPGADKQWKGVVGYNAKAFSDNFGPGFRDGEGFFSVFSIFFPAATGILAGANISGDLKDPQSAIPKGTMLAIVITTLTYLGMAWTAGGCILRDALGYAPDNVTIPTVESITNCELYNQTCTYGLIPDKGAVGIASAFEPLILAGIFSATLSSALASMVGAPKVFQALGKDKLFPLLEFFAKGYGKSGEPRRGYLLTFFICVGMTCIGALDLIAPIISNFFLMAYALINYSCFDASLADSPGFRPAFKFYNKWISLLGALLCLAVMFLINWWAALVTFVVVGALYLFVRTKKPDVNWGSSTQAHAYREALVRTLSLVKVEEHVKNFRPQLLVMSGFPRNRPGLIDFAALISKKQSLLISGHVFMGDMSEHVKNVRSTAAYKWFRNHRIKAFYNSVVTPTLRIGAQVLMQALGIGKLRPNTLLLGYKADWAKSSPDEVDDYFNVIQDAFDLKYGVGILRTREGFDVNKVPDDQVAIADEIESEEEMEEASDEDTTDAEKSPTETSSQKSRKTGHSYTFETTPNQKSSKTGAPVFRRLNTLQEGVENPAYNGEMNGTKEGFQQQMSVISSRSSSIFKDKQYGTIDVYWLFDDGGLTLLIPYILSKRKEFKNCKLRVFCAGTKKDNYEQDRIRLASLLKKFRIEYSDLTVIPNLWKKPTLTMYKEFESTIHKWRLRPHEFTEEYPWKISDSDLLANKQKTYRNIRLREQLLIHSPEASLIVMTLPVPKREASPAALYMGWLDYLTRDLPPTLLLRGNQESVLTYYS